MVEKRIEWELEEEKWAKRGKRFGDEGTERESE